ncbi:MAG: amidohydrolase family protein [Gemmatimonadota bacterium]
MKLAFGALLLVACALLMTSSHARATDVPTYDLVLRGGTVVDGSGLPRYRADVAVQNGFIRLVGDVAPGAGRDEVDVSGLFVAPGFINLHSHAQLEGLRSAENMLSQGVTTEILNADGGGPPDLAEQMSTLEATPLALNVGLDIGFNSVWAETVGMEDRRASDADVATMQRRILAGLEAGAWGVSSGLDYKPAYFATLDEVVRVVEPARAWRTNFTNHDRLTPETGFSSTVGIAETVTIGERSGLVPIITHMKVQGREQGRAAEILRSMQAASETGTWVAADAYPYLAGQTSLAALIIPGWAQEGGLDAMKARFADAALRDRIAREADEAMAARFGGPGGVYMPETGRELVDVMRELGVESGGEAVIRILEENGRMGAILRFGAEDDLVRILQYRSTSVACDCGAVAGRVGHPRYWGSFPRVLGRYVRESGALSWEDAVRKMSALPAATIGMADRGYVAPGMVADLVAFDPATVIDHATFQEPGLRSEGIVHVLVNGRFALEDGAVTGVGAGHLLRRGAHLPSRPMSNARERRASASGGELGGRAFDLALEVRQLPGEVGATGTLRFLHPQGGPISVSRLGVLQVAEGWASVTGIAAVGSADDERAVLVVLDRPSAAPSGAFRIEVEGLAPIEGQLGASPSPDARR